MPVCLPQTLKKTGAYFAEFCESGLQYVSSWSSIAWRTMRLIHAVLATHGPQAQTMPTDVA
jgi:hypothetical protein